MADKIVKSFPTVAKTIDKGAGIYEVMISTEAQDRDGEIVRAAGARVDSYLKNPVVMWSHDYRTPPIAKTLKLDILPGQGLKARFQFPSKGVFDLADTVRGLWDAGFLNAASIGFMPLKSVNLDPQKPWGPQEYVEWSLLEWSVTGVPANQEALRLAMKSARTSPMQALDVAQSILSLAAQRKDQKLFLNSLVMYVLTLSKMLHVRR